MVSFLLPVAVIVAALLYKLVSNFLISRQHAAESTRRGCGQPPVLAKKGFLGITRMIEAGKANKEGRGPQWFKETLDEVGEDVHTVRCAILDYEVIVTRDPENAKAMFALQTGDFEISPHRRPTWSPLLGDGIFTAQGEAWKHSRALIRPQFSREQIMDLELEETHIQAMLNLDSLRSVQDGWTSAVDLGPLFLNFTLDVATEFLYGQSVHSQHMTDASIKADPESLQFAKFGYHLDAGKTWIYKAGLAGKWSKLVFSREFTRHCEEVHKVVDKFVARRLNESDSEKKSHRFYLLDELAKQTQDPLELRNETMHILNAGRDTTGALLGWVFYFLSRNPRVYSQLRASVLAEFGSHRAGEITFQQLRNCNYIQWVINEALRCGNVVPLNERVTAKDTTLPRGGGADGKEPIFLPKGFRILTSHYSMHNRADIWGADVAEFKPKRWEGLKHGWEFMPFGGGPRRCIGQQFALTETAYVIVRFMQRYDAMESTEGPAPPFFHHTVSCRSGTGVQVRLHEASI